MQDALQPTLILTPLRKGAPANGGTVEVLLRLQAPDRPAMPAPARQPLRLAVVIDRSGSMSGEPLQEALRCAEYIAGGLQPSDRLGVVLYDDKAQVAVSLRPGGDAAVIRCALAGVESGGSTALFDGGETGAKLLESGGAASLSRVLLLSDGQANSGLCGQSEIEKYCADWAARGVTTTTVGSGLLRRNPSKVGAENFANRVALRLRPNPSSQKPPGVKHFVAKAEQGDS